jgi:hypothetical protein
MISGISLFRKPGFRSDAQLKLHAKFHQLEMRGLMSKVQPASGAAYPATSVTRSACRLAPVFSNKRPTCVLTVVSVASMRKNHRRLGTGSAIMFRTAGFSLMFVGSDPIW